MNPVRTGYSAIADEWIPIKPGTDGALLLALISEIIKQGLYDREFLIQYTNAAELVVDDPQRQDHGLFRRFETHIEEGCFDPENKLWWDRELDREISTHTPGADPYLLGKFTLEDATPVKPAFQLLKGIGGAEVYSFMKSCALDPDLASGAEALLDEPVHDRRNWPVY